MENAERRMHCLLAVSFTCVCLRLAFICWKGPNTIKCCPFQQINANRKQTQVKLTASKQCIRRSAFGVQRFTPAGASRSEIASFTLKSLTCIVQSQSSFLLWVVVALNRIFLLRSRIGTGRYKSRTGSTRTATPGRINSDRLGSSRIMKKNP